MKNIIVIDPMLKEKLLDGYYFITMYCSNCKRPDGFSSWTDVMVKKGKKIPKEKLVCPNCKCRTLSWDENIKKQSKGRIGGQN